MAGNREWMAFFVNTWHVTPVHEDGVDPIISPDLRSLPIQAPSVQQRLGVAQGLLIAFEDQIATGWVGHALMK
jgi:hypothetical protein